MNKERNGTRICYVIVQFENLKKMPQMGHPVSVRFEVLTAIPYLANISD